MTAYVDNMLWIPDSTPHLSRIKEELQVTPENFFGEGEPVYLYETKPGFIGVPRAWGLRKLSWLTDGVMPEDRTVCPPRAWPSLRFPDGWSYRKGQKGAIDNLHEAFHDRKVYGALLEAACGTGKTLMGLAEASRLHTNTLIVVHKDDLAHQWKETAKVFFPGATYGHVQASEWDYLNKSFVTATAQTIHRNIDHLPDDFANNFGMVIYDEGHRYPARTFEAVLRRFPARYRLAVSATWRRKDRMECVWYWHVGHVEAKCVGSRLTGEYVKVSWTSPFTDYMMREHGETSIVKWCSAIAHSEEYNKWLAEQCIAGAAANRKVLVVSDRVEQLVKLKGLILSSGSAYSVGMYVGSVPSSTGKSRRKVTLEQLKAAASCDIILASYGKMAEGTDIADLDTLIVATPRSDLEQVVGRIQRPHEDKRPLLVVDVVFNTEYNERLFKKREQTYEKLGFTKRST